MTNFFRWVPCPECHGSCRTLQDGPHYIDTVRCAWCISGRVQRRMTRDEVLAALDSSMKKEGT